MDEGDREFIKRQIENEVQLGQHILAVDSQTVKVSRLMPVVRQLADEKTAKPLKDKNTGNDLYAVVGYEMKEIPTTFREPMSPDLTRANLDQDDMKFVQAMLQSIYKTMSFANRYDKWDDCAKAGNFMFQVYASVIDSSRAKDFRGAILAKSTINVQEEKSKHWVSQMQEESGEKKKRWKIF